MRKRKGGISVLGIAAASALTIAVASERAEAKCLQTASCPATNSSGATLHGMNDVIVDDNGCLQAWDCLYDDGYTTRYEVPQG